MRIPRAVLFSSCLVIIIGFAPNASAGVWGETFSATIWKQVMEVAYTQIQGMMLGALKSAAMQALNQQVNQLIGGSSSSKALFITNYETFLYQDPLQKTNLYMNDFFTLTTRGKGASSNYISSGTGAFSNYAGHIVDIGKKSTINQTVPTYDLDNYCDIPGEITSFQCFSGMFKNPMNNDFGSSLIFQSAYQSQSIKNQRIAEVEAQSSGFLGSKKGNQVVAPAGTIEAMAGKVQNIGSDLIASATNPGELVSSAVAAMASQMINRLVQQGIGQAQANMQREISNVSSEINTSRSDAMRNSGPGAVFSPVMAQRTSVRINPNTPAPPVASSTISPCSGFGGSSGSCAPAATCTNGYSESGCGSGLVCCYNPPAGTGLAVGLPCSSYGKASTCQKSSSCSHGYTIGGCEDGLVCCYNP